MAYAGFTVYAGAVAAALVATSWPPSWGRYRVLLGCLAVTALWLFVLLYLKFQLIRRRWAALRRAGCEHLLARWVDDPALSPEALTVSSKSEKRSISRWIKILDYFIPHPDAVHALDTDQRVYPRVVTQQWMMREVVGTEAIVHERILIIAGWLLYFALLARTILG